VFWVRRIAVWAGIVGFGLCAPALAVTPTSVAPAAHPESREDLEDMVRRISREHGIDPRLADALVQVESAYDPYAVSRKGAQGLMQLMPDTADRLDVSDPFDPEQNVRGGMREFARLVNRYSGNFALALAAYNAGEGAVEQYRGVPPYRETQSYVTRIMTLYTGQPYRLPNYRIVPVRMERDANGGVVITNQSKARGKGIAVSTSSRGGSLRGGFGSR
jgi:soluble lytic murein transglycosylase-like protein